MSKVYPTPWYHDPAKVCDQLKHMESVARREEFGCRGCKHSPDAGLSCLVERMPGNWGYCDEWAE